MGRASKLWTMMQRKYEHAQRCLCKECDNLRAAGVLKVPPKPISLGQGGQAGGVLGDPRARPMDDDPGQVEPRN